MDILIAEDSGQILGGVAMSLLKVGYVPSFPIDFSGKTIEALTQQGQDFSKKCEKNPCVFSKDGNRVFIASSTVTANQVVRGNQIDLAFFDWSLSDHVSDSVLLAFLMQDHPRDVRFISAFPEKQLNSIKGDLAARCGEVSLVPNSGHFVAKAAVAIMRVIRQELEKPQRSVAITQGDKPPTPL